MTGVAGAAKLAAALGNACDVTIVPDAAVFALAARAHLVVLPCFAVLADGAVAAPPGGALLARAAADAAVPTLVPTGLRVRPRRNARPGPPLERR